MDDKQYFRKKVIETNELWNPELTEKAKQLDDAIDQLSSQLANLEIQNLQGKNLAVLTDTQIELEQSILGIRKLRLDLDRKKLELSQISLGLDDMRLKLDDMQKRLTVDENNLNAKKQENKSNVEAIEKENITVLLQIEDLKKQLAQAEKNFTDFYRQARSTPYKFKRIAVLLIGHYRTFLLCRANMLDFFSNMADQVDYYFVTWNKTNFSQPAFQQDTTEITDISSSNITVYFGNLLKGFEIVDEQSVNFTTNLVNNSNSRGLWRHLHLTYLAKKAQQLKRNYELENNFVYDQVVETRPDFYYQNVSSRFYPCKDNEFIVMADGPSRMTGWTWGHGYIRTNSPTNDFLANRHEFFLDCANDPDSQHQEWMNDYHSTINAYLGKYSQLTQITQDVAAPDATNSVISSEEDISNLTKN